MISTHACSAAELPVVEPIDGNYFVAAYPPFSTWTALAAGSIAESLPITATDEAVPWGLYVHVPFCEQRCEYCYYLSFARTSRREIEQYVDCLAREAKLYAALRRFAGRRPQFVYFGGGTPSLLNARLLAK